MAKLRAAVKEGKATDGDDVARGFLEFFTALLRDYRLCVRRLSEGKVMFDKSMFLSMKPKSWQPFVQTLVESQPFEQFMDMRLRMLEGGAPLETLFEHLLRAPLSSTKSNRQRLMTSIERVKLQMNRMRKGRSEVLEEQFGDNHRASLGTSAPSVAFSDDTLLQHSAAATVVKASRSLSLSSQLPDVQNQSPSRPSPPRPIRQAPEPPLRALPACEEKMEELPTPVPPIRRHRRELEQKTARLAESGVAEILSATASAADLPQQLTQLPDPPVTPTFPGPSPTKSPGRRRSKRRPFKEDVSGVPVADELATTAVPPRPLSNPLSNPFAVDGEAATSEVCPLKSNNPFIHLESSLSS